MCFLVSPEVGTYLLYFSAAANLAVVGAVALGATKVVTAGGRLKKDMADMKVDMKKHIQDSEDRLTAAFTSAFHELEKREDRRMQEVTIAKYGQWVRGAK